MESTHTAAVDHDTGKLALALLLDVSNSLGDMFLGVVGPRCTAAKDNVNVLVAPCLDNRGETLLGYTHEGMGI